MVRLTKNSLSMFHVEHNIGSVQQKPFFKHVFT